MHPRHELSHQLREDPGRTGELSAAFARVSGLLLSDETVGTALRLVTALAEGAIPGTMGAGISLMDATGARTSAAASDPLVEQADRLQYERDEGPCLTSWADRIVIRIDDTRTDSRWPGWCPDAVGLGLRASLSAPLIAADVALGAMKVYSGEPDAYDERSEYLLGLLATQAAILVTNVQSYEHARRVTDGLRQALRSRDLIGTAKGIVMARAPGGRGCRLCDAGERLPAGEPDTARSGAGPGGVPSSPSILMGPTSPAAEQAQWRALSGVFGRADISVEQLWLRYFALGGQAT